MMPRSALVARSAEFAVLDEFLDRAALEPVSLLMDGEAGIGKSTLLWATAEAAAARGFQVLSAAGPQSEARCAYAAVADLLASVDAAIWRELPTAQAAALNRILSDGQDGSDSDERMVATAFLAVIRRLCSVAPLLLCIDDAQWLDTSSQMVIGFAQRRLAGRVGLVLAVRKDSGESGELDWLNPARPDSLARLHVPPLSVGGLHSLISLGLEQTLPRPAIIRIHEISGGNPFFALELARSVAEQPGRTAAELPASLAVLVQERIGQLDEESGAVLLAAASIASPTVQAISLATAISPDRVVELLERSEGNGVVEIDGGRIRFCHPLFAAGVYGAASPSARRAMHRRLADIVEGPELIARHLALAATTADPDMLDALDAAAVTTQSRGAPTVAAELMELAIELGGDTPLRRIRAAEHRFRAGEIAAARDHLESALVCLRGPSTVRCIALISLAGVIAFDGNLTTAADLLTEAVAESADNPVLQLRARLLLTPLPGLTGDMKRSVELAEIAAAQSERLAVPALRSQALTIKVVVSTMFGLGVDWPSLKLALDLEDLDHPATARLRASAAVPVLRAWSGDLLVAREQLQVVSADLQAQGTEIDILWAADIAAMIEMWLGNYSAAAEIAADCTQRAEQLGGQTLLVQAWGTQAAIAAYLGDEALTRDAAQAILAATEVTGGVHQSVAAATAVGFLEVSLGNYAAALSALEPLRAVFEPDHHAEIITGAFLPDAVEALTALGRFEEAEPLIAALESNGTRHDRPWMLAMGARGRCHLLAAQGDLAAAEQAALVALIHHQRLPMPFETARTQLLRGQVQRRRRRMQTARATVGAALETFERLGVPLWEQRARAELDRMAATVLGAELTAAERRIAEYAAAGLSNKQIAAELFVAVKTVETTLSSVYRKLGIRSRAALSAVLSSA